MRSHSRQLQENPVIWIFGVLCLLRLHEGCQFLLPEKVMTPGKNGDDGDLLLFRDGPGACDIYVGTLWLLISWECSRPIAGVKVSSNSGVLDLSIGMFLVHLGNLFAIISGILMFRPTPVTGECGRLPDN
ncbi:hypothetical protein Tco_0113745, partial [Tanacetum coccineum]